MWTVRDAETQVSGWPAHWSQHFTLQVSLKFNKICPYIILRF